jgi:hypothetical protein
MRKEVFLLQFCDDKTKRIIKESREVTERSERSN